MYWILFFFLNNGCCFEREMFYEVGKDIVDWFGDEILLCVSDKLFLFLVWCFEINLGEV